MAFVVVVCDAGGVHITDRRISPFRQRDSPAVGLSRKQLELAENWLRQLQSLTRRTNGDGVSDFGLNLNNMGHWIFSYSVSSRDGVLKGDETKRPVAFEIEDGGPDTNGASRMIGNSASVASFACFLHSWNRTHLRMSPLCSPSPISTATTIRNNVMLPVAMPSPAAMINAPLTCAEFNLCFADKDAPLRQRNLARCCRSAGFQQTDAAQMAGRKRNGRPRFHGRPDKHSATSKISSALPRCSAGHQ